MRGLSVWIFSKMVMLIFLFAVLGIIMSFSGVLSERSSSEAAESMAIQVKDSIQTSLNSIAISSVQYVPLPDTLPEKRSYSSGGNEKPYSIHIYSTNMGVEKIISVGVGFGKFKLSDISNLKYYSGASSFISDVSVPSVVVNSFDHNYLKVEKTGAVIKLCGCAEFTSCVRPTDVCV